MNKINDINFSNYDFLIVENIFTGHHISLYLKQIIKILNENNNSYLLCITEDVFNSEEFKQIDYKDENMIVFSDNNVVSILNKIYSYFIKYSSSKLPSIIIPSLDHILFSFKATSILIKIIKKSSVFAIVINLSWIRNLFLIFKSKSRLIKLINIFRIFFSRKRIFIGTYDKELLKINSILEYISFSKFGFRIYLHYIQDFYSELIFKKTNNIKSIQKVDFGNTKLVKILVIGYINERKNILKLLKLLSLTVSNTEFKFEVQIAGRIDNNYLNKLEALKKRFKKIKINPFIDKFLNEDLYVKLIENSDIVWVGYSKKHFSSSAVAISCIGLKKPFITFDNFFMKQIIGDSKYICILDYSFSDEKLSEILVSYLNLLGQSKIDIDQSNLLHKTFSPDSFKESFLNFINLGNQ